MRGEDNRQTVSSTARWNYGQSAPDSPGAQKRPLIQHNTGKGSNLDSLRRSLARAEAHRSEISDPRLVTNLDHGIELLKAQIASITGVATSGFDLKTVPGVSTDYEFAGFHSEDQKELQGVAVAKSAYEQTVISSFAQYQLAGTLRQKITKVKPPTNVTPGGSLKWMPPSERSNVVQTSDNPEGDVFPIGVPGDGVYRVVDDTRDFDYTGNLYMQGFTRNTHENVRLNNGNTTTRGNRDVARGKHGQHLAKYSFAGV